MASFGNLNLNSNQHGCWFRTVWRYHYMITGLHQSDVKYFLNCYCFSERVFTPLYSCTILLPWHDVYLLLLLQGNMNYLMCQVGLCMFTQQDDGGYIAKPYNFYVMPQQLYNKQNTCSTTSPQFVCQVAMY